MKWMLMTTAIVQAVAEECVGCAETATMLQVQSRSGRKTHHHKLAKKASPAPLRTASLYESAVRLLKQGATPTVITFTEESLEEIKGTVLPAIHAEHESDKNSLADAYANFGKISSNYTTYRDTVEADRSAVVAKSDAHRSCRDELHAMCEELNREEAERVRRWEKYAHDTDEYLKALKGDGDSPAFCPPKADDIYALDVDEAGANDQRGHYENFVAKGKQRFESRASHETQKSFVDGLRSAHDEKEVLCDGAQTSLELAACSVHSLHHLTKNFLIDEWRLALSAYESDSALVKEREEARKLEYTSLAEVQCLLGKIKDRGGKPCDTSEEADEAEKAIAECRDRHELDDRHADLTLEYPEPPSRPELPENKDYPCTDEFEEAHYSGLHDACHHLKACQSTCESVEVRTDYWSTAVRGCEAPDTKIGEQCCPAPNTVVGGKCYYVHESARAEIYADAKAYCESTGGQIASIHSAAQNEAVIELLFSQRDDASERSAYLGATRACTSAQLADCSAWEWADGSVWRTPAWATDGLDSNDESYNGGETHLVIHSDRKWHDWADGRAAKDVICQMGGSTETARFPGTCTCTMTADNDIDYVYVDGVDMTSQVSNYDDLGNWPTNNQLTFACSELTKMAVQASDGNTGGSAGCAGGGFGMKCSSTNAESPWQDLSTGSDWKAWGSGCTTTPCKYGGSGDVKNIFDPPAPEYWFAKDFDDSEWKQADAGNHIGRRTGAEATICSKDGPGWLFRSPDLFDSHEV